MDFFFWKYFLFKYGSFFINLINLIVKDFKKDIDFWPGMSEEEVTNA